MNAIAPITSVVPYMVTIGRKIAALILCYLIFLFILLTSCNKGNHEVYARSGGSIPISLIESSMPYYTNWFTGQRAIGM
jgi:hypothetical protein